MYKRQALVRIGLFLAILPQAALLSLAWFLPIESCFVLVWSTLLYSKLVCCDILGLISFTLGCLVCCARAGLVGQHSCGIELSYLSHVLGVVKAAPQARPKTT